VLSAVGGFPEIAREGAARLVPPGDPAALRTELQALLADAGARSELAARATALAAERYDWDAIARAHIDLYRRLAA
jgi:glycosyltransferase involved in cell wall biosynthesis